MDDLRTTPLHALHVELGGRMVPFAGYELPVQYPAGVMKEHLHTRAACSLFDVGHMGQILLHGPGAAAALERLVPVDVIGLKPGRQRYALFTAPGGGILDDLMVTNRGDHLFVVVNASRKEADAAHLRDHLEGVAVEELPDRALIAVQGPGAEAAVATLVPGAPAMRFMDHLVAGDIWLSRSGYTGEDGYEISLPAAQAEDFARRLLALPGVAPAGLGARDSLRLEAGMCLYGSDIDATTSPVEAGLEWAIQKVRRTGGAREGGFPGAARILDELEGGPVRRRVGLLPEGRAPMRAGTEIFAAESGGDRVGHVTSGGFAPSLDRPIAMAYVGADHAGLGTRLWGEVRGKRLPVQVAALPFREPGYKR